MMPIKFHQNLLISYVGVVLTGNRLTDRVNPINPNFVCRGNTHVDDAYFTSSIFEDSVKVSFNSIQWCRRSNG